MLDDSAANGTEITELEPIGSDDEDDEQLDFNDAVESTIASILMMLLRVLLLA